jgi:NAD+ diphosphatase
LKPLLSKDSKEIAYFQKNDLIKIFSQNETINDLLCILLGKFPNEEKYFFAVDVSSKDEKLDIFLNRGTFSELRLATHLLDVSSVSVLTQGRSMLNWHINNQFCSICGKNTVFAECGSRRDCSACHASHFPRTDPVVIMLVHKGNMCLLGRKKESLKGVYSCLAGFIEQGETIEEAVARETIEESGIKVGKVTYIGSQPWPYPSQLMIGCLAEAQSETIQIDQELEDVQWFEKEKVAEALEVSKDLKNYRESTSFRIPPYYTIAHQLIKYWLTNSK